MKSSLQSQGQIKELVTKKNQTSNPHFVDYDVLKWPQQKGQELSEMQ